VISILPSPESRNWVAKCRTGHMSTGGKEHSERPTQVTIPGNVDAMHFMTLNGQRISAVR
jgi:hypothetical protein